MLDKMNESYLRNTQLDLNNFLHYLQQAIQNQPTKYEKNTLTGCYVSAMNNLVVAYNDPEVKDLKLFVGNLTRDGELKERYITHLWVTINGEVYETRHPEGYISTEIEHLDIDKNKDLYDQVSNFLHKDSLKERYQNKEYLDERVGWVLPNGDILATYGPHYQETNEQEEKSIRYNFGFERYIGLPLSRPTKNQLNSLLSLLDKFLGNQNIEINFDIDSKGDFKTINISPSNYTSDEIIKLINRIYTSISSNQLREELLLEKNRQELINKSKASDNYSSKNQAKGRNRWERRNHSRISTRVDQYNKIDMNDFFKKDELKVGINVHGETSEYVVLIRYNGVLREIAHQISLNNNKLEFKCVLIALQKVFNTGDVFVSCSCPDFHYRQSYHATRDGYNSGPAEIIPSDITNPNDTKGAGCKHINLVIGNVDWIMKVASVINNYIHYMEKFMERQYADLIFPKLFGISYQKAIQLNLFDTGDDMDTDTDTIKLSNKYGRDRTKFRSDIQVNNQRNWNKPKQIVEPNHPKLQLNLDAVEDETEEEKEIE